MRRAVLIDPNCRGAKPGAKWVAAERHADAVFFWAGGFAGFVPFLTPTDPLRALKNALFQVIGRKIRLAFGFLRTVAQEHIERIHPQFKSDLVEKRGKAEYRLRVAGAAASNRPDAQCAGLRSLARSRERQQRSCTVVERESCCS